MMVGANPAFGRNPEAKPTRSYQLRVGRYSTVELVGIEPTAGRPVTAMATSP